MDGPAEEIKITGKGLKMDAADHAYSVANRWCELLAIPPHKKDGVPLAHLKEGHKWFLQNCSVGLRSRLRHKRHLRQNDEKGRTGIIAGDLFGPVPRS